MKKKIAYSINGLVGGLSGKNYERKNESLIKEILTYCKTTIDKSFEDYDVDYFIFSWHQNQANIIDEIFKPKASNHINQINFDVKNGIEKTIRTQAHLSRWYGFRQVINLISDYSEKTNTEYDFVINARFDICWNNKFNLFDKNKLILGRYIGELNKKNAFSQTNKLFDLDSWSSNSNHDFYLKDLADHIIGSNLEIMKNISNISEKAQELHLLGNGRGPMMSHHRLLPAFLKELGIKQNNINYLHHYNMGGSHIGDYDIFRYRGLTENLLKNNTNKCIVKPWGSYENLSIQENFNLKKIVISPGQQPSYQYHHKRSEHWVVISGEGEVTIDDIVKTCKKDDCIFVPVGSKHRIKNSSKTEDLIFIEIQTGTYFGEDDIVRLQDDYNRT